MGVRDTVFLLGWGVALVTAAWVYGLTGWAVPVLIDKGDG